MRLNEIKQVNVGEYDLREGVIPTHISMTLEQVITAGKVTNNVQNFIIAGLVSMFKEGAPSRWPRDLNSYSMATSSDLVEAVKLLSANESVELAGWLLQQLANPAAFESNPYCNNAMQTNEWVRWVLKRQK
jgi:hypothetical protein